MSIIKSQSQRNPTGFMEALESLKKETASEAKIQVTKMFTADVPEMLGLTTASGTLSPRESLSVSQLSGAKKEGFDAAQKEFAARLFQLRQEDEAKVRKQEVVLKEEIKTIQEEVKLLAKEAGQFSYEIEVASFQAVRSPGAYHRNFFSHLKSIIIAIRKRVTDSRHWLAEFNGRARKRSFYWGQVQQSGTKYMLSAERYMVTSTG